MICTKAREAYSLEKKLLIVVPNFAAAQYVDTLLWKTSPESFLPHTIVDTSTAEWIAITMQDQRNVNQASRLLNLCTTPSPLAGIIEEIDELFDETDHQKKLLSEQRQKHYRDTGVAR